MPSQIDQVVPVTGLEEPAPKARWHIHLPFGRLLGLAVCVASVGVMCVALWKVLHIGTCASGGPYVSRRPCPHGTALWTLLFPAAILTWFASMALLRSLLVPWALLFTGLGATFVAAGVHGDLPAGGSSAAWSVGPLFLLMGLVPAIFLIVEWLGERGDPPAPAPGPSGFMPPVAGTWLAAPRSPRDPG